MVILAAAAAQPLAFSARVTTVGVPVQISEGGKPMQGLLP